MLKDDLFSLEFLKKTDYHGDYGHMRFRIHREEGNLNVCVFPGPYALAYTPEEKVESETFAFDEEGYEAAKAWLQEKYESRDWSREVLN